MKHSHEQNLITYYSSLWEVTVKRGRVVRSNSEAYSQFISREPATAPHTCLAAVKEKNSNSNKTHFIVLFVSLFFFITFDTQGAGAEYRIFTIQQESSQAAVSYSQESLYQIMSDYKLCLMGVYLWQVLVLHYLNFSKDGRWLILTACACSSTWDSIWSKSNPHPKSIKHAQLLEIVSFPGLIIMNPLWKQLTNAPPLWYLLSKGISISVFIAGCHHPRLQTSDPIDHQSIDLYDGPEAGDITSQ